MQQREIKFRAWSKLLQKMFEHANIDGTEGTVRFAWNGEPRHLKSYAGTKYEEDCIPMQFTGLKDKNGKEIYEGDVVEIRQSKHVVEWDNKNGKYNSLLHGYTFGVADECNIIGSIYENPELLS